MKYLKKNGDLSNGFMFQMYSYFVKAQFLTCIKLSIRPTSKQRYLNYVIVDVKNLHSPKIGSTA
jgi:hypothetical protein